MRRSLSGFCTPGTTIPSLFFLYVPRKTPEVLIAVTAVGTAYEAAEERAGFLRSRVLPLNIRERHLGGVAAGVLYGLDLRCGPIADMRGERRHVAVLNGGAAAADVSFEGCKGAARYAVARLEDDLRAAVSCLLRAWHAASRSWKFGVWMYAGPNRFDRSVS